MAPVEDRNPNDTFARFRDQATEFYETRPDKRQIYPNRFAYPPKTQDEIDTEEMKRCSPHGDSP